MLNNVFCSVWHTMRTLWSTLIDNWRGILPDIATHRWRRRSHYLLLWLLLIRRCNHCRVHLILLLGLFARIEYSRSGSTHYWCRHMLLHHRLRHLHRGNGRPSDRCTTSRLLVIVWLLILLRPLSPHGSLCELLWGWLSRERHLVGLIVPEVGHNRIPNLWSHRRSLLLLHLLLHILLL